MARMFTIAIAQGLVLVLPGTTTSADVTFTLEEQFHKLSDNFVSKSFIIKSFFILKILICFIITINFFQNEMRKVLEEKVTRLEEMMELKDRQQV
jgi:cbb3-type cytochrome oxidase subunit 1